MYIYIYIFISALHRRRILKYLVLLPINNYELLICNNCLLLTNVKS